MKLHEIPKTLNHEKLEIENFQYWYVVEYFKIFVYKSPYTFN